MYSTVENGPELLNYGVLDHELTKVSFGDVNQVESEKALRNIYSSILGRDAMRKLISYSLKRFSLNFSDLIQFWGLFNLLITRLAGLNESSLGNPHSLNAVFSLFELNL